MIRNATLEINVHFKNFFFFFHFINYKKFVDFAGGGQWHNLHIQQYVSLWSLLALLNPLTPNDPYSGRTAPLTSKRCILYIYSTDTVTEYFKHRIYSPFFSLQNAVCFIILTYLVPVLFTFYIQDVLNFKKNNSGTKRSRKESEHKITLMSLLSVLFIL